MIDFVQCGQAPVVMQTDISLDITEMNFCLYMPIKFPGHLHYRIPRRFDFVAPLIDILRPLAEQYVYLTVKTMPVTEAAPGNRPGWHIDGFQSDGDINIIWYDHNPTQFAVQKFTGIPNDDAASMAEITRQVDESKLIEYPCRSLLRLDESVVHRVNPNPEACVRTFIKITYSRHKFKKQGNSHNYLFGYHWDMTPRGETRNLDHE